MHNHPADPRRRTRPHHNQWCVVTSSEHPPDTFDLDVFDQSHTWTDRDGQTFQLADLSSDSRVSLADWLRRHARHFYLQVLARELFARQDLSTESMPDLVFQGADEWLRRTPLLRRLGADDAGEG